MKLLVNQQNKNAIHVTDISKTSKGTSKQKLNQAKLNTKRHSKHGPINGVDVLEIPSGSADSRMSSSIKGNEREYTVKSKTNMTHSRRLVNKQTENDNDIRNKKAQHRSWRTVICNKLYHLT